jgi:hypothetical protein
MRQGFLSLLLLPILLSLPVTPAFAEEKTVTPPLTAGSGDGSSASASSAASVYRLLRNAGAEIERVTGALNAKPANGLQTISFPVSPHAR